VRKLFFLDSNTGKQRYKGKESLSCESEILGMQIWCIEMKETASTNIYSTFCHRMTCNVAQDPFFGKHQRKKIVLQNVTFIGKNLTFKV
jgi:hypothetical protein